MTDAYATFLHSLEQVKIENSARVYINKISNCTYMILALLTKFYGKSYLWPSNIFFLYSLLSFASICCSLILCSLQIYQSSLS